MLECQRKERNSFISGDLTLFSQLFLEPPRAHLLSCSRSLWDLGNSQTAHCMLTVLYITSVSTLNTQTLLRVSDGLVWMASVTLHPFSFRCSPTEHHYTVQTCWTTQPASPCWWWAFCCSPLCWSWRWQLIAVWPDTSSWVCASSPTAGLCTRTCPPNAIRSKVRGVALVNRMQWRDRGRVASGCRWEEWRGGLYMIILSSFLLYNEIYFYMSFFCSHCKNPSHLIIHIHCLRVTIAFWIQFQCI